MKNLRFKLLSALEFENFLNKIESIMDGSAYFTISGTELSARLFTKAKDSVKSLSLPIEYVLEPDADTETFLLKSDPVRIAFYRGKAITEQLKFITTEDSNIDVGIFKHDADDQYYARTMEISDNKTMLRFICQDLAMGFVTMEDTQIDKAFSSADCKFKFTITSNEIKALADLNKIDFEEHFDIDLKDGRVTFSSKSYSRVVDENPHVTGSVASSNSKLFKKFVPMIDKDDYEVEIFDKKMIFDSMTNSNKIVVHLSQ